MRIFILANVLLTSPCQLCWVLDRDV